MDRTTAITLIRDIFQNPFDKERYTSFVKNLLNTINEAKAFKCYGTYVPEKFREFVKGYERIGTYTDPEGLKVDVLIVFLKSEATLARARTSQRNFIANYLKGRDAKDAGLIAFVSPNPEDWRFSFVKMDYKIVEKGGTFKAEEEFTPARRYSFLVGSHESSHTAQRQLLPILADDTHNPTLDLIENAFNIETVTKEFFEKYRDLFWRMKEALDALAKADNAIRKEFEEKSVNTADFAKKLLGQIVFLYFLQKKGWFGVARDSAWGSGPKNFLRQLFEGKLMRYKNFFDDVLEPLFYEALAVEGREANFYSKFNCKIPFLNGGLFDPLNGYDWVHTDVTLPNDLFSNDVRTKEGDTGTGILDIFDRYNFTVKEDEPLEKEVAVDPEMLGKVFENLLEVNDRKSKGTYYTPREIVHYMCQESLINYLATELDGKVSKEDIAVFIRMGDTVIEHENRVVQKGEETDTYSYKLPESIRTHAALLDRALATIRVCDPAIGSGAFPVGMMNEVVRARQTLTIYLPENGDRSPYDLKRHAIQESLYGVDIEPSAVEIAKLRLWLSLIVDEDDIERIKPLPNLDYSIMQGNSLLEEFEGIRLFDEKLLETSVEDREKELVTVKDKINALQQEYFALHSGGKLTDVRKEEIQAEIKRQQSIQKQLQAKPKPSENMGLFDAPSRAGEVLNELKSLHRAFFEATQRKKKDEIKQRIESLEWELIDISLTEKKKGDLLAKLKRTRVRPFFLWKLHFADVFREKGGFDVVIANPPYVRMEEIKELKPQLESNYRVYSGRADLYCYFYELGLRLLHQNGVLSYITSNKYLRANYGKLLRQLFKNNTAIASLIDFGDLPVFEATAYPSILITKKGDGSKSEFLGCKIETEDELAMFQRVLATKAIIMPQSELPDDDVWNIERREILELKKKIEGTPENTKMLTDYVEGKLFRGIVTGLNEAFVIDEETKNILIKTNPISAEIIKPFLEGKDVKRYEIDSKNRYILFMLHGIAIQKYPAVESHLLQFKEDLLKRATADLHPWYELQQPQMGCYQEFEKPKIVYPNIFKRPEFAFDSEGFYINQKCYVIPIDDKYLLGFLNSSLNFFLVQQKLAKLRGGFYEPNSVLFEKFPIRIPSEKQRAAVESKVVEVIERKVRGENTAFLESEIDKLVYKIYGLTEDDIKTVEETTGIIA